MTLTLYGIREWGGALILMLAVWGGCWWLINAGFVRSGWIIAAAALILFTAIAFFFRNPHRRIPRNPLLIISPADGTVRDIEIVEDFQQAPFKGKAMRVGIFLSVLNVHVNRAPAEMTVAEVRYRAGKYLDARDKNAGKENEAMTISGTASIEEKSFPIAVRQISGAIARRIVCPVKSGRKLKRGEIYGMIKFGSRTELYLPAEGFSINVKVGDKVKGGESIIATMTD